MDDQPRGESCGEIRDRLGDNVRSAIADMIPYIVDSGYQRKGLDERYAHVEPGLAQDQMCDLALGSLDLPDQLK